ncbi:MAG: hypothetical protein KC964_30410 [Candidatus Omnitrophica bacterium]|nr:hypothetical protein [Candidatus Omnitrophota bacterium]
MKKRFTLPCDFRGKPDLRSLADCALLSRFLFDKVRKKMKVNLGVAPEIIQNVPLTAKDSTLYKPRSCQNKAKGSIEGGSAMAMTKDMKNIVEEGIGFLLEIHCNEDQVTVWVCDMERNMHVKCTGVSPGPVDLEKKTVAEKDRGSNRPKRGHGGRRWIDLRVS